MPAARHTALAGGVLTSVGSASAGVGAAVAAPHAYLGDVPLAAQLPLVGLFFATGGFLLGLLPGQQHSRLGRIRAWLDGLGVTVAVTYVVWLLVFSSAGVRGAALTAVLLGGLALAATVVAGMHATHDRGRMRWYAAGSALCIAGLTALVVTLDYHAQPMVTVVAVLAVLAGTVAVLYRRHRADPTGPPPADEAGSPGYPVLALPLVAGALATAYHLIQKQSLDRISITLAIAGVALVAARETLGALALRRYAVHLTAQGEHLRALVLGSDDVALVLDAQLVVRWQSTTAARLLGLSDQDVLGRPITELLHPDDAERFTTYLAERALEPSYPPPPCEVRLRDGFGAWREVECGVSGPDPARSARSWVVHLRDVTGRRELERTLHLAAYTDRLTTLANRRGLRRAADPPPDSGALIVLDLTGLTGIVDRYGPDVGEAVLVEAARRVRTEVGPADVPARLEGDRLAVLTHAGAVQAHLLASRLLTALGAPYRTPGVVAYLTARAGLADLAPDTDPDEVTRRAELAVRGATTSAVEWYEPAVEARLLRRSAIEQELPGALARGELDLVYQPIVELPYGRPVGAEALLRWRHPELGAVPPAELVPVAEAAGLLDEIGQWVLHWACRQLSGWRREHPNLWVTVNVTGGQLASQTFMAAVPTALEAHGVPASGLVVEVAEPSLVAARDDPAGPSTFTDLVAHLAQLRVLGVRTAVDNFGTGPTSLSQLRVLPLDLLKIDRSVFGPPSATGPDAIADVMVGLGTQLGLEVVAQHLETEADYEVARAAGCRYAQGQLLSPPLPAERLEAYLADRRRVG
jgi:diguanylate cyclase (GGDEF)-like protein/PAS domain S-box-containing protein